MSAFPTRKIGNADVSAIGFGAMGISAFYGAVESDEERFKVLDAAYDNGCKFWDTADVYNDSEDLLGKWFKRTGKRNDIFLATKFGFAGKDFGTIDGSPEYVKAACNKSLKRLGVDQIDLYYLHRSDQNTPIEKTVGAMAELVKEGKVKYLGLSECSANDLRRAYKVHPISAIQVEFSPFCLDIEYEEIGLLKAARELGVAIIAYSPLGRGLLTGQYRSPDDFEANDFRRTIPRFSKENFPNILKIADGLKEMGQKHGASAGQVALAWILSQGDDFIPIPGTKKIKYLKENLDSINVKLSKEELQAVRDLCEKADAHKEARYNVVMSGLLFKDTPPL
jgi:aryl-alcohol dehydrogenase-like predicted oxidoreductase